LQFHWTIGHQLAVWLDDAEDKLVFAPQLNNDVFGKYASWGFDGLGPEACTSAT